MKGIFRSIQFCLIAVLILGCASSGSSPQEQGRTITSIHPGQDYKEIRKAIAPITEKFFEVLEGGSLHQYIQARHSKSSVLFGLYYENGKLTGLIVEEDVMDFYKYRLYKPGEPHWLSNGFSTYRAWIMDRNRLDNGFPDTAQSQRYEYPPHTPGLSGQKEPDKSKSTEKNDLTAAVVIEIITMFPAIGVAIPGYYISKAFDLDHDYDEEAKEKLKQILEALNSLQIGMKEERLVEVMGQLGKREYKNHPNIHTYQLSPYSPSLTAYRYRSSYSFGVMDGKVIWMESPSMLPDRNCPITASALDAIRAAKQALQRPGYFPAALELISLAEKAAGPPECDSARAKILADHAYQRIIESNL